jgi:hypothetical protein
MEGDEDDNEGRLQRLRELKEKALTMHEHLQQQNQQMELDWLRQDIGLLSVQVDRRHAFLTNVRNRARADADLCLQLERRTAQLRASLDEQRLRQHRAHQLLLRQEEQLNADRAAHNHNLEIAAVSATQLENTPASMFSRILSSAAAREEAWRSSCLTLEPFPLSIFEAQTCTLAHPIKDDECAVCLEGMVAGESVLTLPCKHTLHWLCIEPWLVRKVFTLNLNPKPFSFNP